MTDETPNLDAVRWRLIAQHSLAPEDGVLINGGDVDTMTRQAERLAAPGRQSSATGGSTSRTPWAGAAPTSPTERNPLTEPNDEARAFARKLFGAGPDDTAGTDDTAEPSPPPSPRGLIVRREGMTLKPPPPSYDAALREFTRWLLNDVPPWDHPNL